MRFRSYFANGSRRQGSPQKGYFGHSLCAGFVTSPVQAGGSPLKIRAPTGHASDAILVGYGCEGELFTGNVAGAPL